MNNTKRVDPIKARRMGIISERGEDIIILKPRTRQPPRGETIAKRKVTR